MIFGDEKSKDGVGLLVLNPMGFRQLVRPVDEFDRQFGVRRISDVLFLNHGVNIDRGLQGRLALQLNTDLTDCLKTRRTDSLSEMHQLGTVAGKLTAEFC